MSLPAGVLDGLELLFCFLDFYPNIFLSVQEFHKVGLDFFYYIGPTGFVKLTCRTLTSHVNKI